MANAYRDENSVPTLIASSNADGFTPVRVYADPVTHRLLVDLAGGSGTVTSVSVVTANGFAGTVANPTTTPAITLTTTVTGILKGNGTAMSAAVANTDYQVPIALTTAGTSGAATFNGTTLNIPQYAAGTGDVVGPASATDNAIARFDGTTGKLIQNSAATIADTSGNITAGTYNANTIGAGSTSGTNTGDQTNITGNAGTATKLATGRTIAITGDLAYTSPSFDGSANVTAAGTLATVNSNVGSFTNANITVNAKGLVTAAANGSAGGGGITIGTTTITSGTNTRILYDNSGVVGEYTLTGTGTVVVMATSPTLVTPTIGAAVGTSLTLSSPGTSSTDVPNLSNTVTFTNKRITRRTASTAGPGATPTTNTDNVDLQIFTALATAITSMTTNLSGTPTTGQRLEFWLTDNGTARAITWGASFSATTIGLPTTTVISTLLKVYFEYNGSTWACVGIV